MQATHSRPRQTNSASISSTSQTREAHGGEYLHHLILAVLFASLATALTLVIVNRGPELTEQTLSRLSYPIHQAIQFAEHPIVSR